MSDVQARIAEDVKSNDVLLYMKGTPVFPQCGFSSMAVQILSHLGVKFKAVDVLADPEVREKLLASGLTPRGVGPQELAAATRDQLAKYARLFRQANIKAD